MASLPELLEKLDSDPRVRGFQFEHLIKWYLENDPIYRLELKKVWLWKEWTDNWGHDAGIDLIAETFDGKLWAIQTKAYSPDYAIKKSDVDTFLSESSREIFSYRLLVATTNHIGNTAKRTLAQQEKPVGLRLLYDLEKSSLSWTDSPDDLKGSPPEPKRPLPHQEQAISDVCQGFDRYDRGQLIMACGTGKTFVALWVAEKLHSRRTLVLSPSLSILAYTLREWTANASEPFHYLAVCSDETVQNLDEWTSGTVDLGLPVKTDPEDIARFLLRTENVVVFSTYQSNPAIAEALRKTETEGFNLAIADEAHRCASPEAGPFAMILNPTAIRTKLKLFMTGTPRYFSGHVRRLYGVNDYDIASMDDEKKFGPVFHRLSFSEAIRRDLLSDYRVAIVAVDHPTYRDYAERGTFVTTESKNVTDARTVATHIALAKAIKEFDLRKVVSFHSRVNGAKQFSRELPGFISWMPEEDRPLGSMWADYVSGEMPSGKRDAKLNKLRCLGISERGLLANARCLVEGVDLPQLDAVAFIDPRASQVDIVQAVGRALRKSDDQKIATIVLPVFVDSRDDSEHTLEKSAFKPVWDVLKALRSHDDILAEALDQLRRYRGEFRGKITLPGKIILNFPTSIDSSFSDAFAVTLVEQSTASWEFWFGLLKAFVTQTGNALVSKDYQTEEEKFNLGGWVVNQRARRESLSKEQFQALDELPGWTWAAHESRWNIMFGLLKAFVKENGHSIVSAAYQTEKGVKLGIWVNSQRQRKEGLSKERRQALEKLPGWTWAPRESRWNFMFGLLQDFVNQNEHSIVNQDYQAEGLNLGGWVSNQRTIRNRLSKGRRKALQELPGWTWAPRESAWDQGFRNLEDYYRQKGHTRITLHYESEDGYRLGTWVNNLRNRRKALSPAKQEALGNIPGWTWQKAFDDAWELGLERLKQFVEREGHTLVPQKYTDETGFTLGGWVSQQRQAYRRNKLSQERQTALESLLTWVWKVRT
jgi:superfamily II DNA or RNA helicase